MDWKLKIRNETVKLELIDNFVTFFPTERSAEASIQTKEQFERDEQVWRNEIYKLYDKPKKGRKFTITEPIAIDLRLFARAGWNFRPSTPALRKAAERREKIKVDGEEVTPREVFVTKKQDGREHVLVTTSLVTLQLDPNVSPEEAEAILKKDKFENVRSLGFGRNLYEVEVPSGRPLPDVLSKLQSNKKYLWVEPTLIQTLKPKQAEPGVEFAKQWQHFNTGFDEDGLPVGKEGEDLDSLNAWRFSYGEGVRIAVIDSGMQIDHPDLASGIVGGGYFTNDEGVPVFHPLVPGAGDFPAVNHGTFCMGLAAARSERAGQQDQGGSGIAPRASLIAIACPSNLLATQTTLACAIHFAVQEKADVISCSLDTNRPLMSVLEAAIKFAYSYGRDRGRCKPLGIPIFWAVNNLKTPLKDDPVCNLKEVIAVGKYNRMGEWGGGAWGKNLAFLAPGVDVFSTTIGSDNMFGSGTSYATPLAAGVAALVLSLCPDMDVEELRAKLIASCERMGAPDHDRRYGYGKLNAYKAVYQADCRAVSKAASE